MIRIITDKHNIEIPEGSFIFEVNGKQFNIIERSGGFGAIELYALKSRHTTSINLVILPRAANHVDLDVD